jgi:branched-subunit amino acid transport protein
MNKVLFAVCLMAVVTYVPRVLPIAICNKEIKSPFLKSFLSYIPFAVLGAMTFPGILTATSNYYFSLIGMGIALILAYYEQGLMKVALGAVLVVYLCELYF